MLFQHISIILNVGGDYFVQRQKDSLEMKRSLFYKFLYRNIDQWKNVEELDHAQLGCLLRAYSIKEDIQCTLLFDSGIPVESNLFMTEIFNAQPFCNYLI